MATARAKEVCRAQHGGQSVSNVVFGRGHSNNSNPHGGAATDRGPYLGWFFDDTLGEGWSPNFKARARQSRTWEATCKKVIRRTRK